MLIKFNNGSEMRLMRVHYQSPGSARILRSDEKWVAPRPCTSSNKKVPLEEVVVRPQHKYGRVIRIDADVFNELLKRAEPFDNPNDVLRRVFNLPAKRKHAAFAKGER